MGVAFVKPEVPCYRPETGTAACWNVVGILKCFISTMQHFMTVLSKFPLTLEFPFFPQKFKHKGEIVEFLNF